MSYYVNDEQIGVNNIFDIFFCSWVQYILYAPTCQTAVTTIQTCIRAHSTSSERTRSRDCDRPIGMKPQDFGAHLAGDLIPPTPPRRSSSHHPASFPLCGCSISPSLYHSITVLSHVDCNNYPPKVLFLPSASLPANHKAALGRRTGPLT